MFKKLLAELMAEYKTANPIEAILLALLDVRAAIKDIKKKKTDGKKTS